MLSSRCESADLSSRSFEASKGVLFESSRPRHLVILSVLVAMVAILYGCSVVESFVSGQHRTMYDNPIYRWRESMAIALSRMQEKPLHGYVAYRSIRDYLAQHGLGLMEGEATPLPTAEKRTQLVFDGPRIQKLIQDAAKVPIDTSLPPVTLNGNEKGLADYYYIAFRLFGINLRGLAVLYYLLLGASLVLFFLTFHKWRFGIFLLMTYLVAHFYMVGYASAPGSGIATIHNSRFFPVLSFLPAMHLLLLAARREHPTAGKLVLATGQLLILLFVIFCRIEAAWQLVAIVGSPLVALDRRRICQAVRSRAFGRVASTIALQSWPAMLAVVGMAGLLVYSSVAIDSKYYATETKTHVFWHALYTTMIGASPQLSGLYLYGEERDGDNLGYQAVLADLRSRNDSSPDIAYVADGKIYMDANRDMGVYDQLVRRVFFKVVAEHPWLALKSFLIDKPIYEVQLTDKFGFLSLGDIILTIPLVIAASLVGRYCGVALPRRYELRKALPIVLYAGAFANAPILLVPSSFLVDTYVFYLIIVIMYAAYLHVAALRSRAPDDAA